MSASEEKMGFKGPQEPAFPMQSRDGHETFNRPVWGLTKREYFAAKIMQGLCANPNLKDELMVCETSVRLADALIKKLG